MRGKIMLETVIVAHCHPVAQLILAIHASDRIRLGGLSPSFCFREYPVGWQSHCTSLLLHCTHRDQLPHRHVVTGCDGIKSCAWKQGFVWHGHGARLSKTNLIVAMYRPHFVLQSIVLKEANPSQSEFRIVQHGSFSVRDVGLTWDYRVAHTAKWPRRPLPFPRRPSFLDILHPGILFSSMMSGFCRT